MTREAAPTRAIVSERVRKRARAATVVAVGARGRGPVTVEKAGPALRRRGGELLTAASARAAGMRLGATARAVEVGLRPLRLRRLLPPRRRRTLAQRAARPGLLPRRHVGAALRAMH
eukprot:9423961-Alexandrium_andersonii.AAC.1